MSLDIAQVPIILPASGFPGRQWQNVQERSAEALTLAISASYAACSDARAEAMVPMVSASGGSIGSAISGLFAQDDFAGMPSLISLGAATN